MLLCKDITYGRVVQYALYTESKANINDRYKVAQNYFTFLGYFYHMNVKKMKKLYCKIQIS